LGEVFYILHPHVDGHDEIQGKKKERNATDGPYRLMVTSIYNQTKRHFVKGVIAQIFLLNVKPTAAQCGRIGIYLCLLFWQRHQMEVVAMVKREQ